MGCLTLLTDCGGSRGVERGGAARLSGRRLAGHTVLGFTSLWFWFLTRLLSKLDPTSYCQVRVVFLSAAAVLISMMVGNQLLYWGPLLSWEYSEMAATLIAGELGWQFSIVLLIFGVTVRPRYRVQRDLAIMTCAAYVIVICVLFGRTLRPSTIVGRCCVLVLCSLLVLLGAFNAECIDRQQWKACLQLGNQRAATTAAEARCDAERNLMAFLCHEVPSIWRFAQYHLTLGFQQIRNPSNGICGCLVLCTKICISGQRYAAGCPLTYTYFCVPSGTNSAGG